MPNHLGLDPHIVGLDALRQRIKRLALVPVTEALRSRLNNAWESGTEAFIRAAIRRVLVDTGMSAATFLPLSRALGAVKRVRAERSIEDHINRLNKHGQRPGIPTFPNGNRRSGFQSREAGEAIGEQAYILQTPDANARFFIYRFSFQTVAFQHAIHEDMRHSLEDGIQAFRETIQIRFVRDARLLVRDYLRGRPLGIQREQ